MTKSRKFVVGDIHSHHRELQSVLRKVNFQKDLDLLISLGDLVDRGPNPIEVVEELRSIKNFIHVLGNHDYWFLKFLKHNIISEQWVSQGGSATAKIYQQNPDISRAHAVFFDKAKLYYIDNESRLFVHGGYDHHISFQEQCNNKDILLWDRSLITTASNFETEGKTFSEFTEIFIGHTPTQFLGFDVPIKQANLWMLDTGIYKSGRLTIMDIETKEYWQS